LIKIHAFLFLVGNAIQDPQMVYLPYDELMMLEDTFLKDGWHAMAEGQDIINKEYTREQKNKFFNYVLPIMIFTQIPETAREVLRQMRSHIICFMTEKNSGLFADSWNQQLYSKESLHVLKRAARVLSRLISASLICKKQKRRQKKHK
jgi:hypothetical protein